MNIPKKAMIGAEAAIAPSTADGYFILNQDDNMPP